MSLLGRLFGAAAPSDHYECDCGAKTGIRFGGWLDDEETTAQCDCGYVWTVSRN